MNITINIKETTPRVTIIKDEKHDLEQINLMMDSVLEKVLNDPEQGEKARKIGAEKLKEMGLKMYQEKIKENEQEQINNALELTESFNNAMIKGIVKGAIEIAKKL
jgi:flagellar biosynthesis/type III secretory pathway protein FliH